MPFPRILLAVPLVAAGIVVPVIGPALTPGPAGVIGMGHETFKTEEVTIRQGEALSFVNDSRFIHIIGAGRDGHLDHSDGVPLEYRRLMETNATYTSPKWTKPGTFYLTCSVHPEMTLKVIVTECGCCSNGTC
jgi:plastocyanin